MAAAADEKALVSIKKAVSGETREWVLPQCPDGNFTAAVLTITPPQGKNRTPSDIVLVVDISGSMGDAAEIKNASGGVESCGLNLLDIAKHGVKTVINTLDKDDRCAVVLFNHQSQVLWDLRAMDEANKKKCEEDIEGVSPGGGTTLWLGMFDAFELLRKSTREGRFGHIMLLTDGQTTQRNQVIPEMSKYLKQYEKFPGSLSTFGFGYNIDSPLLETVSSLGHGTYSFIPDAGFVGTVFVNTLSNLLCTCAMEVNLSVEIENGAMHFPIGLPFGGEYADLLQQNDAGTSTTIFLGNFQYDQPRNIVLAVKSTGKSASDKLNIAVKATYVNRNGEKVETECADLNIEDAPDDKDAMMALYRAMFAGLAKFAVFQDDKVVSEKWLKAVRAEALVGVTEDHRKQAQFFFQEFAKVLEKDEREQIQALLKDVQGQSWEAVSREDWWSKWGGHYLRSIMFAHRCQLCNNFKDASVQMYGGELFQKIQEKADEMFNTLPPPKPIARPTYGGYGAGAGTSTAAAPVVNMSMFNNSHNVCIDRTCEVQMADGSRRAVGQLAKGDRVASQGGKSAEVVCVVVSACEGGKADLVHLPGGTRVTAWHPVFVDGQWRFPGELGTPEATDCDVVCSVVLQGAASLLIGSEEQVICAAMGHGVEEGAARHPYFGTDKVLRDMECFPGFASGLVEIQPGDVLRDPETGLVCEYRRRA